MGRLIQSNGRLLSATRPASKFRDGILPSSPDTPLITSPVEAYVRIKNVRMYDSERGAVNYVSETRIRVHPLATPQIREGDVLTVQMGDDTITGAVASIEQSVRVPGCPQADLYILEPK